MPTMPTSAAVVQPDERPEWELPGSHGWVRVMVDGASPEHELAIQGRLEGHAPEIDPVVYLTDCDPAEIRGGNLINARIVGATDYDLIARPVASFQ